MFFQNTGLIPVYTTPSPAEAVPKNGLGHCSEAVPVLTFVSVHKSPIKAVGV